MYSSFVFVLFLVASFAGLALSSTDTDTAAAAHGSTKREGIYLVADGDTLSESVYRVKHDRLSKNYERYKYIIGQMGKSFSAKKLSSDGSTERVLLVEAQNILTRVHQSLLGLDSKMSKSSFDVSEKAIESGFEEIGRVMARNKQVHEHFFDYYTSSYTTDSDWESDCEASQSHSHSGTTVTHGSASGSLRGSPLSHGRLASSHTPTDSASPSLVSRPIGARSSKSSHSKSHIVFASSEMTDSVFPDPAPLFRVPHRKEDDKK